MGPPAWTQEFKASILSSIQDMIDKSIEKLKSDYLDKLDSKITDLEKAADDITFTTRTGHVEYVIAQQDSYISV